MQRQVPNFIQEQGSCVGHFETANSLRDRSGESALLVPKQFAFRQVKGNGCAIQLYERTKMARSPQVLAQLASTRVKFDHWFEILPGTKPKSAEQVKAELFSNDNPIVPVPEE